MKRRRRLVLILAIVAIFVAALIAATTLIVYTDRAYICENTGSRMGYREWFFGSKTDVWYQKSELEKFLETTYSQRLNHRWTSYVGEGHSLMPGVIMNGHGRPGRIVLLEPATLDEHVRKLTDAEKVELYEVFSSAEKDQIEAAIEAICFAL